MTTPKQQIAFPEVAVLRKGTPKVKGQNGFIQGSDLGKYFRIAFYPGTNDSRQAWQRAHPETYVKYDMSYRRPGQYAEPDGFEVERLRAMVPFRSVFDAWEWANEAHSAGRMVAKADDEHYLMLRDPLTGKYIVQNGEPYTEYHHGDVVRYEKNGKQMVLPIRTVGRLRLFVPELERMVFITLKTTSFYDRLNIDAHLSAIQFLANTLNGGNAAGVPFYIYRREQEVTWNKPDGSAARVKKWLVNIEADPEWVKVATARMANFALTGTVSHALLAPPTPAQMAAPVNPYDEPDEPGDEPDYGSQGDIIDGQAEPVEPPAPSERPYSAEILKAKLASWAQARKGQPCSEQHRTLLAGMLEKAAGGKLPRHEMSEWLFGAASTAEIPCEMVLASLKDWLEIKDWNSAPSQAAIAEAQAAHAAAVAVIKATQKA